MSEKNTLSILETIKRKMQKLDRKPEKAPLEASDDFKYISSKKEESEASLNENVAQNKGLPKFDSASFSSNSEAEKQPDSVDDFNFEDLDLDDEKKFSQDSDFLKSNQQAVSENLEEEDLEDQGDDVDFLEELNEEKSQKAEESEENLDWLGNESDAVKKDVKDENSALENKDEDDFDLDLEEDSAEKENEDDLDLNFLEEEEENIDDLDLEELDEEKEEDRVDDDLDLEEEEENIDDLDLEEPDEEKEEERVDDDLDLEEEEENIDDLDLEESEEETESYEEEETDELDFDNLDENDEDEIEEKIAKPEIEKVNSDEKKNHSKVNSEALERKSLQANLEKPLDEVDHDFEKEVMGFGANEDAKSNSAKTFNEAIINQNSQQQMSKPILPNQQNELMKTVEIKESNQVAIGQKSPAYQETVRQVNESVKKLIDAKNIVSGISTFSQGPAFGELAAQLMEPKLEKWCNEYLAELVEKIVREEIKRIIPKD